MDLIYYLLIAVIVLGVLILAILTHAGFFYDVPIRITAPASLPHRVAYSVHKGPYKNAGRPFGQLSQLVPKLKLFGVYYDSPKEVPQDQLRYIVGCCLPEPPNSRLEERLTSNGYSVWTFPHVSSAVVTEFPLRSMLSLFIAPWRVYPALEWYCKKFKLKSVGPWVEVCEGDCVRYTGPLENNEGFFVPEVSREAKEEESKKKL